MDIETIFQRLGLSKQAYPTYRALQKSGPLLIAAIVSQTASHRPAIYSAIHDLLKHGFISLTYNGKRKLYQALSPNIILREFSQASEKVASKIAKISPVDTIPRENIRLLAGRKGVEEAFGDVVRSLPRGEMFYRYTSERDLEVVNSYLPKDYREVRDKKKLERQVISNPESGMQKRKRLERFIKYIPHEHSLFDHNIIQTIYGDRVSFIDLNTEKVVIIENKALAEFQKVIFKQLYKKLE